MKLAKCLTNVFKLTVTDIAYMDFDKAFDKVDHRFLVFKLSKYGLPTNLVRWFEDYLSDRRQRVTMMGESSIKLPVLSGVPQGSIMGPLFF